MKTYEKPRLMALSLSGNDQLCGSCAGGTTLHNDHALAEFLMNKFGFGDSTDGVQKEDFAGVFGTSEHQCTTKEINNYCKFSAVDSGSPVIAWS